MLLECTKKLADLMKVDLVKYEEKDSNPLFDWTVTLITKDNRKGILMMNNKTKYPIILFGLKSSDFMHFDDLVLSIIRKSLLDNGFPLYTVNKYLSNLGNPIFSKTHNRSILGKMASIHNAMEIGDTSYYETSSGYSFGLSEIACCFLYKDSDTQKVYTGVEAMKEELDCDIE